MNNNLVNEIKAAKALIVHGGSNCHLDEFTFAAVCCGLGFRGDILRRDPTAEELASTDVLVGDVGMTHNPSTLCWDHHQRTMDEAPKCAFRLLMEDLGMWRDLTLVHQWLTTWSDIDVQGPFATSRKAGM